AQRLARIPKFGIPDAKEIRGAKPRSALPTRYCSLCLAVAVVALRQARRAFAAPKPYHGGVTRRGVHAQRTSSGQLLRRRRRVQRRNGSPGRLGLEVAFAPLEEWNGHERRSPEGCQ